MLVHAGTILYGPLKGAGGSMAFAQIPFVRRTIDLHMIKRFANVSTNLPLDWQPNGMVLPIKLHIRH
jgi:hypothetical protein